jgi:HK97 family phage portal protein
MNLFGYEITKAARKGPSREEIAGEARASSIYVMPWQQDKPITPQHDYYMLVDSFKSWVYVCASKNAQAVAKVPLKLYVARKNQEQKFLVHTKAIRGEEEKRIRANSGLTKYVQKAQKLEEVIDHPFYDLINSVNPTINRFDLWELTQLFLEMTGNAYWYVVRGPLDIPVQIWPVPTQGMKIVTGRSNLIKGYVYKVGIREVPFSVDEIVHFRFNSMKSQLYGYGPMQAAMEAHIFDQRIKNFEGTLLANMGRPEGVLQTDNIINDVDFERIKTRWSQNYAGEKRVGKTLILEKGLKYQAITMTPKDINYFKGRQWNREEIAAVFGVPMSKLTSDNVNRANAEAGDYQYATDTVEPRLKRMEEKLNEQFIPMFDDSGSLFCSYDTSIPENQEFRLQEINSHLQSGYTTINEERAIAGKEEVEWGDKPIMPATYVKFGELPPQPPGALEGNTPEAALGGALGGGDQPPKKKPVAQADQKKPTKKDIEEFVNEVIATIKSKRGKNATG